MHCDAGFASCPLGGIPPCGDGWHVAQGTGWARLMLADGLGHGTHAHQLVNGLKDQLDWIDKRSNERSSLERCIREMHKKLRKGDQHDQVAAGLIEIDTSAESIAAIILGNIQAYVLRDDRPVCIPSINGMLGGRIPTTLRSTTYPLTAPALLFLCSDGIDTKRALEYLRQSMQFAGFSYKGAEDISQSIVDQYSKGTDDSSCIIVKLSDQRAVP